MFSNILMRGCGQDLRKLPFLTQRLHDMLFNLPLRISMSF